MRETIYYKYVEYVPLRTCYFYYALAKVILKVVLHERILVKNIGYKIRIVKRILTILRSE